MSLWNTIALQTPRFSHGHLAQGASFHKYYYKSFILPPDLLLRMVGEISETLFAISPDAGQSLSIFALRKQGQFGLDRFEIRSIDELLAYPNPSGLRLMHLTIRVVLADDSAGALVSFQDHGPGWSVALNVEGSPANSVQALAGKLRDLMEPTFQWYSFLSNNRGWTAAVIVLWLAGAIFSLSHNFQGFSCSVPWPEVTVTNPATHEIIERRPATGNEILASVVRNSASAIVLLVGAASLLFLRPLLFPKGIFLLGQEVNRHEALKKWRWAFVTSLLLPLLQRAIG